MNENEQSDNEITSCKPPSKDSSGYVLVDSLFRQTDEQCNKSDNDSPKEDSEIVTISSREVMMYIRNE
jgi:hypothetical protein